jgi:hypothetical protein
VTVIVRVLGSFHLARRRAVRVEAVAQLGRARVTVADRVVAVDEGPTRIVCGGASGTVTTRRDRRCARCRVTVSVTIGPAATRDAFVDHPVTVVVDAVADLARSRRDLVILVIAVATAGRINSTRSAVAARATHISIPIRVRTDSRRHAVFVHAGRIAYLDSAGVDVAVRVVAVIAAAIGRVGAIVVRVP